MLLSSKFDTLFYVPSSDEVMRLDAANKEQKEVEQIIDHIQEETLDKIIKESLKPSTLKHPFHKHDEGLLRPFRKVSFSEAYTYGPS